MSEEYYGDSPNTAALLKRAFMFLEDGDFASADKYCERVLDQDPECAEAYLGKLMAELSVKSRDSLKDCANPFDDKNSCIKASKFSAEIADKLKSDNEFIRERNETERKQGIYDRAKSIYNPDVTMSEQEYMKAASLFESTEGFMDSDELKKECLEKAETARKDELYDSAVSMMDSDSVTEESLKNAAEIFREIPCWKDSEEKIGECEKKAEELRTAKEKSEEAEEKTATEESKAKKKKEDTAIIILVAAVFAVLIATIVILVIRIKNKAVQTVVTNETTAEVTETEVTINIGETVDSGTCGDNLTWTLDDNGNLIIEGTGEMDDYFDINEPWYDEAKSIKACVIRDGVTSIGEGAFCDCCNLTSITISDSVTSIGGDAFYGCESLTSITIPDSVTSTDEYAFTGCTGLTSITIPDSVTSIGDEAFYKCENLTNIKVESGNKNYSDIDGVLFNKNKTELICYPEGKTDTSYKIPDGVTSIGESAFEDCDSLTSITIPDSVTSIGEWAFLGCTRLTNITIPDGVTSIGEGTFDSCDSLTSITIPDSVTSIGGSAFGYCGSLTSITIPKSVTSIGASALSDCESLTDVYYGGSESDRDNIEIGDYNSELTNATWHYNG